jgi:hypothetical protein
MHIAPFPTVAAIVAMAIDAGEFLVDLKSDATHAEIEAAARKASAFAAADWCHEWNQPPHVVSGGMITDVVAELIREAGAELRRREAEADAEYAEQLRSDHGFWLSERAAYLREAS